jgi:hypothetical protein
MPSNQLKTRAGILYLKWDAQMNTRTTPVLLAAALLTGCVAASGPQSLPDRLQYDRITNAHVDVGSVSSADELFRLLPRVLARHGYFVASSQQTTPDGFQFLTDWRIRPIYEEESFAGAQQARTRLVIDARRRGTRYALTLYAVSYVEDANGRWRAAPISQVMEHQVRDIGRSMLLDLR